MPKLPHVSGADVQRALKWLGSIQFCAGALQMALYKTSEIQKTPDREELNMAGKRTLIVRDFDDSLAARIEREARLNP